MVLGSYVDVKKGLVVEVGKAEAILPNRERVPGEDYSPGADPLSSIDVILRIVALN